MFESINVLGEKLESCCTSPMTGFYRDGFCNTNFDDQGIHTVCIHVTDEFLRYSKMKGNDLSSDMPEFGFKGLKEGDHWCLCAGRWLEAYKDGHAPKVYLASTHEETTAIVSLEILEEFKV